VSARHWSLRLGRRFLPLSAWLRDALGGGTSCGFGVPCAVAGWCGRRRRAWPGSPDRPRGAHPSANVRWGR